MSVLGEIFGGAIRSEMKKRVDEILKSGAEWNKTAQELVVAINKLEACIKEGKPSGVKELAAPVKQLGKQTMNLANAFTSYREFLVKLAAKYG